MKLSFSTQYLRGYSFNDLMEIAQTDRMSGIELYDVNCAELSGKTGPFNPQLAAQTRRALVNRSLEAPALCTVSDFCDDAAMDEIAECTEYAANLNIPYVIIHTEEKNDSVILQQLELILERGGAAVYLI